MFGLKILGIGGAHFGRHDVPYWYRGDEGRTFSWELGSPDIAFASASGGIQAARQVEAVTERRTPGCDIVVCTASSFIEQSRAGVLNVSEV